MSSKEDFSPQELATWSSLATLLEWLPAALDAQLQADAGMSHFEFGMLFALADAPEHTLRMSVLASYANSTLSRLSRAATRMEKRGWIRREPDPADGRFTLAILLEAGRDAVSAAAPGHTALVRRVVFERLTRGQLTALDSITRAINEGLQPHASWPARH